MGYDFLFLIILVLTVGSIHFSRRDVERWRRMLPSHIILMGLCSFTGAMAFFPGVPGIILGLAGLLPASVASMQLSDNGLQNNAWNRRAFSLELEHAQLTPGEELLEAQDRIDEENDVRSLGRRAWTVFLPGLAMGVAAVNFESWLMGGMALGVAAVAAWIVQPAFATSHALPVSEKNEQLASGSDS